MRASKYFAAAAEREQEFQKRERRWLSRLTDLEAALKAAQAPAAEPQWRPIAIVPMNGEAVIAHWRGRVSVARFRRLTWRDLVRDCDVCTPDGWMPLPAAPLQEGG